MGVLHVSFASLLNQSLTLHRTLTKSRDEIGGSDVATETSVTVDAYIYPVGGEEDRVNRNTQLGEWRALVPADTDVDGWDRASYDGREFDIIAPPEPVWNPRTMTRHHVRLRLQEVQ